MEKSLLQIAKQADLFFMNKSPIHETMLRLNKTLSEMDISFAVAGAMAANVYGHRRTTNDVDILITKSDLQKFKEAWLGRGWVEKFERSKGFRDANSNIDIDVLLTGDFPGDGLEKPVSFPEPKSVLKVGKEGIPYISLASLLELKLASGMTAVHRPRDLDDVIQLIRVNKLPQEYAGQLNPYVHEMFAKMWQAAQVNEDY